MTHIVSPIHDIYKDSLEFQKDSKTWIVNGIKNGTTLYAPFNGKVKKMQKLTDTPASWVDYFALPSTVYSIVLVSDDNVTHMYMTGVETTLTVGDKVKQNDVIGHLNLPNIGDFNFLFYDKQGETKVAKNVVLSNESKQVAPEIENVVGARKYQYGRIGVTLVGVTALALVGSKLLK